MLHDQMGSAAKEEEAVERYVTFLSNVSRTSMKEAAIF
jgi:hypothetical protein